YILRYLCRFWEDLEEIQMDIILNYFSFTDAMDVYMDSMSHKHQFYIDMNGFYLIPGFNTLFVRLCLVNHPGGEEGMQFEAIRTGGSYIEMMETEAAENYYPTSIKALFDPGEDGITPKVVVFQGPAGIGKTWTAKWIMVEWTRKNLYREKFHYVFYLSCKEIHCIKHNISMANVLSELCGLTCGGYLGRILNATEKILFIIDGFEELQFLLRNEAEGGVQDPFQEVPKAVLFNSLLKRRLLPKATLLLTTRPFALNTLRQYVVCPRYVEVLGFTEHDRLKYFYDLRLCKKELNAVVTLMEENRVLSAMCALPFICNILKTEILKYPHLHQNVTTTDIYIGYLKDSLMLHGRWSSLSSTCTKMCRLAKDGVWNQKFVFEEEDLDIYGLIVSEVESLFLNEIIIRRNDETRTCYSFSHQSIQVFFASLYYVLEESEISGHLEHPTRLEETMTLLERSQVNPHLTLTLRFLFGLYSEVKLNEVAECVGRDISTDFKSILEDWLVTESFNNHNEILQCLYETQDEVFVRRMMSHLLHLRIQGSGSEENEEALTDKTISYCLETSECNHMIRFNNYTVSNKIQKISSALQNQSPTALAVIPIICPTCSSAKNEAGKGLPVECIYAHLQPGFDIPALRTVSRMLCICTLQRIPKCIESLMRTQCVQTLQDLWLVLYGTALEHNICGLQGCGLTSSHCKHLCSFIITNRSLITLDLSGNDLQDSGVNRLCEGLRQPDCVLQELRLERCGLTSSCCEDLRSVIATNRSLIKLDLSHNTLRNSGVKRFCEGLQRPGCVLQELRLRSCGLTFSCFEDLVLMMNTTQALAKMDMSGNNLQDSAVKRL
uniref:NACHT domain-containing protein n=1 Tax=Leptobrachium leishanense TaxID=445787 RepID=A0A8C5MNQ3_9ANUR